MGDSDEMIYVLGNMKCCMIVFDSWIQNGDSSDYPLSWKSVYAVLCAINHRGTAERMKSLLFVKGIFVT